MELKCLSTAVDFKLWLRKKMMIMRLLSLFMLIGTLHMSGTAFSQKNTATIHAKNKALINVLDELRDVTGYSFVYSSDVVDENSIINIDAEDQNLSDILNLILAGQELDFKIVDDVVVISAAKKIVAKQELVLITGKVMEAGTNDPLPGANVLVKDGMRGTVTDIDGNFAFEIPSDKTHLIVRFIGFNTQEVEIKGRDVLHVFLDENVSEIGQVVVTGMQKREKSQMIGSVNSIGSEQMEMIGATTVDEAMKGQMAGVYVRSTTGNPGEVGEIVIRGTNTMTGNRQPLYVLDGMPLPTGEISGNVNEMLTHGLGNIPPEDIESITILRDATAASVYGSRAANGVVVITTKQGKSGKDYISYSGKFGVTTAPSNQWNFMNSNQKIDFERQLYNEFLPSEGGRVVQILNSVNEGYLTQAEGEAQIAQLRGINTNWMDEMYRTAFTQSHNVTMSGGTDRLQYHISANYNNSEGSLIENNFQTGGLNMKLNRFVNENLLVKVNLYTTLKERREGISAESEFKYAVFANPYERAYNPDGSYATDRTYLNTNLSTSQNPQVGYNDFNIIRELKENTRTSTAGQVRGQVGVEYTFLDDFRFQSTASFDYNTVHGMDEIAPGTYTSYAGSWIRNASTVGGILPEHNLGRLEESMGRSFNYTVRNSLEYNKRLDNHYFQGFGAIEFGGDTNYQFNSMMPIYLSAYRLGGYFPWGDINIDQVDRLFLERLGGTSFRRGRSASFIGSGVYSYDNRYVANFNIRYDGVDIIGNQNQFQPLWSAGVKWNAHEEGFMKDTGLFDRMVFSFGYGYRGSINRSTLPFHTYGLSTIMYDGIATGNLFNYGNPALKWEQKRDINLGIELSVMKGRVNFEANYFDEKVTDLLDQVRLPISSGRPSAFVNVGELSNQGFEISGRFEVIKQKDFTWEVGANFTTVRNTLDQVYERDFPNTANTSTQNIQGHAVNSWFGYKFSHIDEQTGNPMVWAQRKHESVVNGQTTIRYEDELIDINNMDQKYLTDNYAVYHLGQNAPKFYGGFNTRVFYKGFDLTANFVYAGGNKLMSFMDVYSSPNGGRNGNYVMSGQTNLTTDHLYRWTQAGDITNIPGYSVENTNYQRYLSDAHLESGAYLRCSNISIGWRAPAKVTESTPFSNMTLRMVGSNLFTITPFTGSDPETNRAFGYPITPSYTLSVTLGF